MESSQLLQQITQKKSFLCVGMDTDPARMPKGVSADPAGWLAFNRAIIAATAPYTVAYKFNIAFYEALGPAGWQLLADSLAAVPAGCFTIADAKRGDIGNTASMYARAFFEQMSFDAITVAPYMGSDSVLPFLEYVDKWVFLLAITSNTGAADFQHTCDASGTPLYLQVVRNSQRWHPKMGQLGYVAGATQPEALAAVRKEAPKSWLLVPGVGAQGGDLHSVCQHALNNDGSGLLVNSSRGILYASAEEDYAARAAEQALVLQQTMSAYINAATMRKRDLLD